MRLIVRASFAIFVLQLLTLVAAPSYAQPAKAPALAPPVENSIGMKLQLVPAGQFNMGQDRKTEDILEEAKTNNKNANSAWYDAELPKHPVTVKAFYLGTYTVTQEEYTNVMGSNPSWFASTGDGKLAVKDIKSTGRFPVENVSWRDAQEFCAKLSAQDKRTYRLPTEAEWEYACRAGTTSAFNTGRKLTAKPAAEGESPKMLANFCDDPRGAKVKADWIKHPVEVGSYPPNAFGLYDMHGNVWQWCQNLFTPNYGTATTKFEGVALNPHRALRGGSWASLSVDCRSSRRLDGDSKRGDFYTGFRVALDADQFKDAK